MTPDCELRAFEPFFTTKRGGGRHLGTGLSRAYQVATDHGGYIDLGENPRGGCLVTVEFALTATRYEPGVVNAPESG